MEERLIGTWEMPASTIIYDIRTPNAPFPIKSKEVVKITFTSDHKEVWRSGDGPIETVARWHLEGNDLVFTLETQTEAGPPGTTKRERIKTITLDELIFTDGTTEGRWTRVR
jgi:hypothetical protein